MSKYSHRPGERKGLGLCKLCDEMTEQEVKAAQEDMEQEAAEAPAEANVLDFVHLADETESTAITVLAGSG